MVEPFFDRSKAIYREGLYRSLEIFSNHVNNSGGCTHNPAEHSPTTTSLPPPPAMRRYLPLPLSFPRMTEEFGSGDRRWQPAAANSARCLRAFRRRTATNPRRPIDSTADKNIGAAFHAQSVPPLHPPTPPPSTARWRKNDGPFCLASIFSLSLSSRSFVFPYFSVPFSSSFVGRGRFSSIKFDLESFGRVHEISRRYERERDKGMEILTLARLPRGLIVSWPLIGLIGR